MGLLHTIFYSLTPYTDARERSVGRFFKGLSEHDNQSRTRSRLLHLLQRNIAVINLWTEYRYKGYSYLGKGERKKLYANLQLIAADFDRFYTDNPPAPETVVAHLRKLAPHAGVDPDRAGLLYAMVQYFSPAQGRYEYRESSSFGRLLRDPSQERLVGDCNQIVTLYIYLYSRYYDVRDLQIRTLPGHVALHYNGIDIETTNSTFANYDQKGQTLAVEEIVAINLLDTTDSYLSTHEVDAESVLQASRLAFILSHDRELVQRNLDSAYGRLINALMKRHNYDKALEFATDSRDMGLLNVVGHNGAIYEMKLHNYSSARRFAEHALKKDELVRTIWHNEGSHYYGERRYHDAIKAFKHLGDHKLVARCYEALFFEEQRKLPSDLTNKSIQDHADTVKRLHKYAKKSGNKKLVKHADSLSDYL